MANRKNLIIAAVVVFGVLAIAGIALGVYFGGFHNKNNTSEEPTELPSDTSTPTTKIVVNPATTNPNQWNVVVDENVDFDALVNSLNQRGPSMGWNITGSNQNLRIFSLNCRPDMVNMAVDTMGLGSAMYVEQELPVQTSQPSNAQLFGLDRIDQRNLPLNQARFPSPAFTPNGAGANVFVIDTGISPHSEFGARLRTDLGRDFVGDGRGPSDCQGHGTHCAGTVGGTNVGVAKGATLIPVRVLSCSGSGSNTAVISGLDFVANSNIRPAIASMSLGGPRSSAVDAAVTRAVQRGVTVVAAAGNENADACGTSPGGSADSISVGATDSRNDQRASFSNFGTCVDIFAPGVQIASAQHSNPNGFVSFSGTSMACPHVAGVAAVFLGQNPTATPAQVRTALLNSATNNIVGNPGAGSPNKFLFFPSSNGVTPPPSPTPPPPSPTPPPPSPTPPPPPASGQRFLETNSFTGPRLARFHPTTNGRGFYQTTVAGTHVGRLTGPSRADFDLALFFFNQNTRSWSLIASSNSATSSESITFNGIAGFYSWRVSSFSGSGQYSIEITAPN